MSLPPPPVYPSKAISLPTKTRPVLPLAQLAVAIGVDDPDHGAAGRPAGGARARRAGPRASRSSPRRPRSSRRGCRGCRRSCPSTPPPARPASAEPLAAVTRSEGSSYAERVSSGSCEDPLHHHRHHHQRRRLVCGDRLQRLLRVELALDDVGRVERQPEHEVGEAPGVEQRGGDHRRLARVQRDPREQRRQRAQGVGLAALGALRGSRRPRGEDDEAADSSGAGGRGVGRRPRSARRGSSCEPEPCSPAPGDEPLAPSSASASPSSSANSSS